MNPKLAQIIRIFHIGYSVWNLDDESDQIGTMRFDWDMNPINILTTFNPKLLNFSPNRVVLCCSVSFSHCWCLFNVVFVDFNGFQQ